MAKKKMKFSTGIRVGGKRLDLAAIRSAAEHNPQALAERMLDDIEAGKITVDDIRSLPELWHALRDLRVDAHMEVMGRSAPITTGAFPLLVGGLTVAGMNSAFEAIPTIGQELVTEMDSSKKTLSLAAVVGESAGNLKTKEGEDFKMLGAGERRFDIVNDRRGFRQAITAEMLEENDIAGFKERIDVSGELPAEEIEELTLRKVTDHDGSASSGSNYVLKMDGANVALYQTDNDPQTNLGSSGNRVENNALVDETDLDNARALHAAMLNDRGKRMANPIGNMILLVPDALMSVAGKILGSDMTPGVENERNMWGPRGPWQPRPLSSAKLDELSTSAWYLGAFSRLFVRKWKLRLELATLSGNDTENFVRRRIAFEWRVAWDVEVGARTQGTHVVQSLSATTAPKDE